MTNCILYSPQVPNISSRVLICHESCMKPSEGLRLRKKCCADLSSYLTLWCTYILSVYTITKSKIILVPGTGSFTQLHSTETIQLNPTENTRLTAHSHGIEQGPIVHTEHSPNCCIGGGGKQILNLHYIKNCTLWAPDTAHMRFASWWGQFKGHRHQWKNGHILLRELRQHKNKMIHSIKQ